LAQLDIGLFLLPGQFLQLLLVRVTDGNGLIQLVMEFVKAVRQHKILSEQLCSVFRRIGQNLCRALQCRDPTVLIFAMFFFWP
jgi:hypothetical protein